MTRTFIKGALTGFVFGPLSSLFLWVILSAAISVEILVASILLGWNGETSITLDMIVNWDTSTLPSLPYFSLIDYIQIMWAGLLLPIIIGSGLYIIVLAQGTGTESKIVDYFRHVVMDILIGMALFTMIWILGGTWYAFPRDSAVLHNSNTALGQFWIEFEDLGMQGLQKLGLDIISINWETVMTQVFPYIPIPFYLLAYFWLFSNIHAGWIGNIWGGSE